jgi:GTP 3',8-cyclase
MSAAADAFDRPLRSLRISVTDRCNMRCRYCMPEDEYVWLPRASILTFEEIARLAAVFTHLGVENIRVTGGEPLLRQELATLVGLLRQNAKIRDLSLTTNGILLAPHAAALRQAGLDRVTVSLDTLRPDRLLAFSRSPRHADILAGIAAAGRAGFTTVKINTVVIRGFNDDEMPALLEFARGAGAELRFIEYMDVGGATRWSQGDLVSQREILEVLGRQFGRIEPVEPAGRSPRPATRFALSDGTTFGVIASVTAPFCRTCDRARLTADGTWLLCLYAEAGIDLRGELRRGATDGDLAALLARTWRARADRGAEERLALPERGALYQLDGLRADPHREMHTRGG